MNIYELEKFNINPKCWIDASLKYINRKIDDGLSDVVSVLNGITDVLCGDSFEGIRLSILLSAQKLLCAIKNNNDSEWKKEQERFYTIFELTIPKFLEKKDTSDYMRDCFAGLQKKVLTSLPAAALYAVNCIQQEADDRELIKRLCCEDIAEAIRNGSEDLKALYESVPTDVELDGYKIEPCKKRLQQRLLRPIGFKKNKTPLVQVCNRVADDFLKGKVDDDTFGDPHPLFEKELSDSVVIVDYFCEKYGMPNPFIASFGHALNHVKKRQIGALEELSRSVEVTFPERAG